MNDLRDKLIWHMEIGRYIVVILAVLSVVLAFVTTDTQYSLLLTGFNMGMFSVLMWVRWQLGFEE